MDDKQDEPQAEEGYESRLEIKLHDDLPHNFVCFELIGRLDIFTYRDLSKAIMDTCHERKGITVLVDLSAVSFVASSGWSVFVATRTRLKSGGGRVALCGLSEELMRVYEAMHMPKLVPSFGSRQEAREALADVAP